MNMFVLAANMMALPVLVAGKSVSCVEITRDRSRGAIESEKQMADWPPPPEPPLAVLALLRLAFE